jgi:hypothetical protein
VKHLRIELSTGTVDVYDNAVPLSLSTDIYNFLIGDCGWYLGWKDTQDTDLNLHARLEQGYPKCFEIPEQLKGQEEFEERMQGMDNDMVIANLSHASSVHHKHTHPDKDVVILYYANLRWQEHWEGETMFFSEDGEVEYTCKYTPGRIVVFNGRTPHTIRAQSAGGPPFRMTISYFWQRNDVDNPE